MDQKPIRPHTNPPLPSRPEKAEPDKAEPDKVDPDKVDPDKVDPDTTDPDTSVILIAPVCKLTGPVMDTLCAAVQRVFGFRVRVSPFLKDIEFAYDFGRNQYHSTPILEQLSRRAPDCAVKVLAVTDKDLFIPILTHVFGEAQLGGAACIISTFRLREGLLVRNLSQAFSLRIIKEAVHEIGHTFDLRHCPDPTCIMHYCRTESDVDRKTDRLCRYCSVQLADIIKRS